MLRTLHMSPTVNAVLGPRLYEDKKLGLTYLLILADLSVATALQQISNKIPSLDTCFRVSHFLN